MSATPELSVVIPMYRTRRFIDDLWSALATQLPTGTEVVFVDDCCPEASGDALRDLAPSGPRRRLVALSVNSGQHAAVLAGIRASRGPLIAVMDADMQDTPEALNRLLSAHRESAVDVVCSSRAGAYEEAGRQITARAYRWGVRVLSGGRVPHGAGIFSVFTRAAAERVLDLDDPFVPLVPAFARTGASMHGLSIHRQFRAEGESAYSGRLRLRVATRGLVTLTPAFGLLRRKHQRRWRRNRPTITITELNHDHS